MPAVDDARYIDGTRQWIERAVVGLNLCPFARAPLRAGTLRLAVSQARTPEHLLENLAAALEHLRATPPAHCETTLLIHPFVLGDFLQYNDFLDLADALLAELALEEHVQIASFHPHYQFADSAPDDIENCSNRSPWPTLHLLRQESVTTAVDAMGDPDAIWQRNQRTLRALGKEGWRALQTGA